MSEKVNNNIKILKEKLSYEQGRIIEDNQERRTSMADRLRNALNANKTEYFIYGIQVEQELPKPVLLFPCLGNTIHLQ